MGREKEQSHKGLRDFLSRVGDVISDAALSENERMWRAMQQQEERLIRLETMLPTKTGTP